MRPDAQVSVRTHWTRPFLRPDAFDPPWRSHPPDTLPPAPCLFIPSLPMHRFPCCPFADILRSRHLSSRPPPRYPRPPAFFPLYPLSFNPVTNLSLNPFLIWNSTNITSASPTLQDSLSPLAYSADVFPSLLPQPSSLPTRSALLPPPSDPSPSPPISGGRPPSLALLCGSLLSSPHPISSTPCLSPPPRPLIVRSRAPTVFPGF